MVKYDFFFSLPNFASRVGSKIDAFYNVKKITKSFSCTCSWADKQKIQAFSIQIKEREKIKTDSPKRTLDNVVKYDFFFSLPNFVVGSEIDAFKNVKKMANSFSCTWLWADKQKIQAFSNRIKEREIKTDSPKRTFDNVVK